MDPNKYFSGHNPKSIGRKQKMLKNMQSQWQTFTLSNA